MAYGATRDDAEAAVKALARCTRKSAVKVTRQIRSAPTSFPNPLDLLPITGRPKTFSEFEKGFFLLAAGFYPLFDQLNQYAVVT